MFAEDDMTEKSGDGSIKIFKKDIVRTAILKDKKELTAGPCRC